MLISIAVLVTGKFIYVWFSRTTTVNDVRSLDGLVMTTINDKWTIIDDNEDDSSWWQSDKNRGGDDGDDNDNDGVGGSLM